MNGPVPPAARASMVVATPTSSGFVVATNELTWRGVEPPGPPNAQVSGSDAVWLAPPTRRTTPSVASVREHRVGLLRRPHERANERPRSGVVLVDLAGMGERTGRASLRRGKAVEDDLPEDGVVGHRAPDGVEGWGAVNAPGRAQVRPLPALERPGDVRVVRARVRVQSEQEHGAVRGIVGERPGRVRGGVRDLVRQVRPVAGLEHPRVGRAARAGQEQDVAVGAVVDHVAARARRGWLLGKSRSTCR